jgi:putative nucleotidyltransferase with HDIG domain
MILLSAMKRILRGSVKVEILGIVFLSIIIITAILGYFSFQFSKNRLIFMLAEKSKAIAATAADFISGEDIFAIKNNIEGLKKRREAALAPDFSPAYEETANSDAVVSESLIFAMKKYLRYMDLLTNVKKVNNIESPINIYIKDRSRLMLIFSTERTLPIGALYGMRPEIEKVIADNAPEASRIYKDKDGLWISAFAPIAMPASSNAEAVLEVDNRIDLYLRMLRGELAAIVLICLIGLVGTSLLGYKLVDRLVSAITKLDELAGNIEQDNYNVKIEVKSKDEIGHLAETFEKLRLSIRKKIDELKLSLTKEKRAHFESVIALSNAIEVRDPYTRQHLYRVERYALLIARAMRLPRNEVELLRYGCYLHDIGKLYVDDSIFKKTNLTDDEVLNFKQHAKNGAKIIEGIPFLQKMKDIILYHQEKYDGTGYPEGLKGERIPLLARIVAVADSFDAMTTDRPYKNKVSFKDAIKMVEAGSGTQFDPAVVKAFLKHKDTLEKIAKKHFRENP